MVIPKHWPHSGFLHRQLCQFSAPYHILPLLQLRNVGHAEVLRIELHHLCAMQHLSTDVVHGNSNAKWVTLWQPSNSSTLFCFAMSQRRMRNSNFRWVQTSVGFFCFKLHLLRSPTTFAHHKTLQGSPTRRYNIF